MLHLLGIATLCVLIPCVDCIIASARSQLNTVLAFIS
jgi:hypothetical protein